MTIHDARSLISRDDHALIRLFAYVAGDPDAGRRTTVWLGMILLAAVAISAIAMVILVNGSSWTTPVLAVAGSLTGLVVLARRAWKLHGPG